MVVETGFTLQDLEAFLLILMRVTSFVMIAPFFGMNNTPSQIKVGMSIFISMLLYTTLSIQVPEYQGILGFTFLVVSESVAGLLIGFSAHIANTIILFTGRLIDMEIGMAMSMVFDPLTKSQASLTGSIFQYVFLMMMIMTDMHHFLLRALADSFLLFGIGGMKVTGLYDTMIGFLGRYFVIGFQLVLPVFTVTLLVNIILGIMSKVAPQMNMFAVGMQLKIIVGLVVLFLIVGLVPRMGEVIFTQMRWMVTEVLKGMY